MNIRNALRKRREISEEKKRTKIEEKNIAFVNGIGRMSMTERQVLQKKLEKKLKKVDDNIKRLNYLSMQDAADKSGMSQTLHKALIDNYTMEKKYLEWQIKKLWKGE